MSNARADRMRAAAARPPADAQKAATTPAPAVGKTTTNATVILQRHTWAALRRTFVDVQADSGVQLDMTKVGATLFDLFLEDPQVQAEVIKRLTK